MSRADAELVDRIVDTLKKKPNAGADQEFMDTPAGVMLARKQDGVYALYQLFTKEPPRPFLLRFWYCGRYNLIDGRDVYDFE